MEQVMGYAESKPGDTYKKFMYDANHVNESKDVAWFDWEPKTARDMMSGVFKPKKQWMTEEIELGIDE